MSCVKPIASLSFQSKLCWLVLKNSAVTVGLQQDNFFFFQDMLNHDVFEPENNQIWETTQKHKELLH